MVRNDRYENQMQGSSLRDLLTEWTDMDFAQYALACSLGLMSPDDDPMGRVKHVFWAANPIGDLLFRILGELVAAGILGHRDEPDYQYRWNQNYRGGWE